MSIRRVKPGLGIWVKCDGTDTTVCNEKRFTANIVPKHNRAHWAKTEGWGRGLRSSTRTWDLCPEHMEHERKVKATMDADREAKKKEKLASLAKPKKPRKKKGDTSPTAAPSPSAGSAQAAAT